MNLFLVDVNSCLEPILSMVELHSFDTCFTEGANLPVPHVFQVGCPSQIVALVVQSVSVPVVDLKSKFCTHDLSVNGN